MFRLAGISLPSLFTRALRNDDDPREEEEEEEELAARLNPRNRFVGADPSSPPPLLLVAFTLFGRRERSSS